MNISWCWSWNFNNSWSWSFKNSWSWSWNFNNSWSWNFNNSWSWSWNSTTVEVETSTTVEVEVVVELKLELQQQLKILRKILIFDEKFDFPISLLFDSTCFETRRTVRKTEESHFLAFLPSLEKFQKSMILTKNPRL